jgi:hypothetical protein
LNAPEQGREEALLKVLSKADRTLVDAAKIIAKLSKSRLDNARAKAMQKDAEL